MGGIYLVPIPIAIPLILIIICLMPAIPVSWPFIIIHKIYVGRWRRNPGEKEQLPPLPPWREIAQDCRNWMMYSIIIPWISIVVLWLMCIAQILLLPYYLARCAAAIVGLPVQIYELYVLFRAWCQQQSSSSSSTEQQKQLLLLQQQQKVNDRPVSEPKSEPEIYTFSILPTSTSIRILTLQPSPNLGAPLEGSLSIANLNTQPTYDALSYTWTTDSDSDSDSSSFSFSSSSSSTTLPRPCSITLYSSPTAPPATLPMSSNCALALRRLRHPSKPRKLWIDAICINQSDLSERAAQVSLMARIFCSARKVVVYTGESDPETDQLYDWLNDLDLDELSVLPSSRSFLGSDAGGTKYGSFGFLGDEVAVRLEQHVRVLRAWKERTQKVGRELWGIYYLKRLPQRPKEPADLRGTLRRYFSRRWFRRVWVLQEVSLPDLARVELLCGAKKTTGERGMHLLGMLMREREENQYVEKEEQEEGEMKGLDVWRFFVLLRSRDAASVGRREEGAVLHKRSHLLDILIETRGRECEDPRDKIFGVLNIARGLDGVDLMDENRLDVDTKVSYFDSVAKVYASYSALFIRRHGPGFFLALIKSEARVQGLPSWAADWTASWPNERALQGTVDFPARSRSAGEKDRALEFDGPEKDTTGQGRMALKIQRPRIVRGFFAWTGQRDGDERIQIVEVKQLDRDEVLVEMYPGLAVLLRRERGEEEYYTFIRVCPHSLSKDGVERLVARWSRAVVYQENAGCVAEAGSSPRGYLGRTRVWKIV